MMAESGIYCGIFDDFTWIRCEGKGSFMQSPSMKEYSRRRMDAGERHFVIDLEACTGMDSTFMGFLAGLASQVGRDGGRVEIAQPGDRNRHSLEDLGLDCLLKIDPAEASWQNRREEIRSKLEPFAQKPLPNIAERSRHVLDAHQDLAKMNEENAKRFADVIGGLSGKGSGSDGSNSRRGDG